MHSCTLSNFSSLSWLLCESHGKSCGCFFEENVFLFPSGCFSDFLIVLGFQQFCCNVLCINPACLCDSWLCGLLSFIWAFLQILLSPSPACIGSPFHLYLSCHHLLTYVCLFLLYSRYLPCISPSFHFSYIHSEPLCTKFLTWVILFSNFIYFRFWYYNLDFSMCLDIVYFSK